MLILGYFRSSVLMDPLEPLLEIGDKALLSYDQNNMFIITTFLLSYDGLYDAYLRLDLFNFCEYHVCDEVGSREVNLVKFYSFLETKKDVDDKFWACISKLDIHQDRLIFQLGKIRFFFRSIVDEHLFGEFDLGFVNREEDYMYKIVVWILKDNFARIIHQVRQSFTIKISEKEVEIEECGIVLRDEDDQCEVEGVSASDEPYSFLVEVTKINLGAFLKASKLSNKVCLHIDKPNRVKAMLEFHIPQIGSFRFYYLQPRQNRSNNEGECSETGSQ